MDKLHNITAKEKKRMTKRLRKMEGNKRKFKKLPPHKIVSLPQEENYGIDTQTNGW